MLSDDGENQEDHSEGLSHSELSAGDLSHNDFNNSESYFGSTIRKPMSISKSVKSILLGPFKSIKKLFYS